MAERKYLSEHDPRIRPTRKWRVIKPELLREKGPGCNVGCVYCNQSFMDRSPDGLRMSAYLSTYDGGISVNRELRLGSQIVAQIEVDDLLQELNNYPYFDRNLTPVVINNFSDPGLNWEGSIQLAERIMREIKHNSTAIFITKMPITDDQAKIMKIFMESGGKPIVIYSCAGMPLNIEKIPVEKRLNGIRTLSKHGIPVILSLRPLIQGVNDSEENLRNIAEAVRGNVNAVIYGGLFVDDDILRAFEQLGYELHPDYYHFKYQRAKFLPECVRRRVKKIFDPNNTGAILYDHTTCATAYVETVVYGNNRPNRMALWVNGRETNFPQCGQICDPRQLGQCMEAFRVSDEKAFEKISEGLRRINPGDPDYTELSILPSNTQRGMALIVGGALNIWEQIPLMEISGRRVDNLPYEEGFLYRASEAFQIYFGLDTDKLEIIKGAEQVGQEWILYIDSSKIPNYDERLVTLCLRSNARCRCHIVDMAQQNYKEQSEKLRNMILNQ